MGKYYCDYCDVFLTHDSSSVRKAHNSGRNHLTNVKDYYSSLGHDKAQDLIDQITKMYESGGPPPNMPFPQAPNSLAGLMGGLPMRPPGMPNFQPGAPIHFGQPQGQFQPPPQQNFGPPQGFNGPPMGMGAPPPGFRAPPGMGAPPPGFFPPPGMQQGGPPPGFGGGGMGGGMGMGNPGMQQGGPAVMGTGGPPPPKLVNGMNPDRARQLGRM